MAPPSNGQETRGTEATATPVTFLEAIKQAMAGGTTVRAETPGHHWTFTPLRAAMKSFSPCTVSVASMTNSG